MALGEGSLHLRPTLKELPAGGDLLTALQQPRYKGARCLLHQVPGPVQSLGASP